MLWDGIKQATRTARSRKAERSLLDNVSLPWGQQVAVVFQTVCALALDVPAAAESATDFTGVFLYVLLAYELWGHVDHAGVACGCRSSDQMGAYVHAVVSGHSVCRDMVAR